MAPQGRADAAPAARPALIRSTPLQGEDESSDWSRLLPAWIISGVIHVVLMSMFLIVTLGSPAAGVDTELVVESRIGDDADQEKLNLTRDDMLGDDPTLPGGYDVKPTDNPPIPGPPTNPADLPGIVGLPPDTLGPVAPPFGIMDGQGGAPGKLTDGGTGDPLRKLEGGYSYGKFPLRAGPGGGGGATRDRLVKAFGGNTLSELCVARGLGWIVRHQRSNGSWGMHDFHTAGKCNCNGHGTQDDMAATALALLPLLGAGETHIGTSISNRYSKELRQGLEWMLKRQGADGTLGGGYAHPIAAIVLCEAYGLTADPNLRRPAQLAISKVVDWQAPGGGFRYSPKQPGDLSVTGWHLQALMSGQMAGLNVPAATFKNTKAYLDSVSNEDGSHYGYTRPTETNYRMDAVGLLCREYLDCGPRYTGLVKGIPHLTARAPSPNLKDIYYYYYATQAIHHSGNMQAWEEWNPKMRDLLINSQDQGNDPDRRDQKGSWSPDGDPWGRSLGRLGTTSLAVLTLEVYYRRLPLYWRQLGSRKDDPVRNAIKN